MTGSLNYPFTQVPSLAPAGIATGGSSGVPRVTVLPAVAGTYTPDADTTDIAQIVDPAGNFNVGNPSGTPANEQQLIIEITSLTGFTAAWGTAYINSGVASLPSGALPSNKTVTFGFFYKAGIAKWVLMAADAVGY